MELTRSWRGKVFSFFFLPPDSLRSKSALSFSFFVSRLHIILGRPEKAFQVVALRLSHSLSFFSEKVPWEKEGGKDALARYMPGMELQREDLFRSAKHFPPYSLFVFISMKAAGRKRVSERARESPCVRIKSSNLPRSLFSEILPSLYLLLSHIQCHIREATVPRSVSTLGGFSPPRALERKSLSPLVISMRKIEPKKCLQSLAATHCCTYAHSLIALDPVSMRTMQHPGLHPEISPCKRLNKHWEMKEGEDIGKIDRPTKPTSSPLVE